METLGFEVVYVDKFKDFVDQEITNALLQERFKLGDSAIKRMSSGKPVLIKKGVPRDQAEKLKQAIQESGGVCWIQAMTPDAQHHERRLTSRRKKNDRRMEKRGSAVVPDRRTNLGRRTSDSN